MPSGNFSHPLCNWKDLLNVLMEVCEKILLGGYYRLLSIK